MLKMASSSANLFVIVYLLCKLSSSTVAVQVHLQFFALTQVEDVMTDAVNAFKGLLPNSNVTHNTINFIDSTCERAHTALIQVLETIRIYGNSSILIGPTCSLMCETVGLIAAKYDVVLISPSCIDIVLSNKKVYPTVLRSIGAPVAVIALVKFMLNQFSWRRLGLIMFAYPIYMQHTDLITAQIAGDGITLFINIIKLAASDYSSLYEDLSRTLNAMKHQTRVFFVLGNSRDLAYVLLVANSFGLLSGEYVFIGETEADTTYNVSIRVNGQLVNVTWPTGLLGVTPYPYQPAYVNFSQTIETKYNIDGVSLDDGFVYDAVLLAAFGIQRMIAAKGYFQNGISLMSYIMNNTFEGVTGHMYINENGDRPLNYSVISWQNYSAVNLFDLNGLTGTIQYAGDLGLLWLGNQTTRPSGEPICGWMNNKCFPHDLRGLALGLSIGAFIVIVSAVIISCCWFGRWSVKEVSEQDWIILPSELNIAITDAKETRTEVFPNIHPAQDMVLYKNFLTDLQVPRLYLDRDSVSTLSRRNVLIRMIALRGKLMFVRKIEDNGHIKRFRINIKQDIIQIARLKHDNLAVFCGLCLENPACYMMEFYRRGSLADILGKRDYLLPPEIKCSIAIDIVMGMEYLHKSAIGSHGHLTSLNCLLDHHFVCKVSDYGLGNFKNRRLQITSHFMNQFDLLWTAPELLRTPPRLWPLYGTKAGDVFSFGILLHELVQHEGPYCIYSERVNSRTVETIMRVKNEQSPPYRPEIRFTDEAGNFLYWLDIMQNCWLEQDNMRPTFSAILLKLTANRKDEAVDAVVQKLEQYNIRLEVIVRDRMVNLEREKELSNEILNSLLPSAIVVRLMRGVSLEPELFSCVTLCLTDVQDFHWLITSLLPSVIVSYLAEIYNMFDEIIASLDVCKLSTCGDSVLLASGLPEKRDNDKHASILADAALTIVNGFISFNKLHNEKLTVRIGIHSGKAIVSYINVNRPQYRVFGDIISVVQKVVIKSRNSQPLLTGDTAELLPKNDYVTTPAGDIEMEESDKQVSVFTFISKKPSATKVNATNARKLQIVAAYGVMDDTSSTTESYTALAKRVTKHLNDAEQTNSQNPNEDSLEILAPRQQRKREEMEPDSIDQLVEEVAQLDEGQHEVIHALGLLDKPQTVRKSADFSSLLDDDHSRSAASKGTNNNNGSSLPPLSPRQVNNKALASTLARIVEDIDSEQSDSRERLRRLVSPPPKH